MNIRVLYGWAINAKINNHCRSRLLIKSVMIRGLLCCVFLLFFFFFVVFDWFWVIMASRNWQTKHKAIINFIKNESFF